MKVWVVLYNGPEGDVFVSRVYSNKEAAEEMVKHDGAYCTVEAYDVKEKYDPAD